MPYQHSGEIGDVWKHLPLCDILVCESPSRYFETNSAYSQYKIEKQDKTRYGIFRLFEGPGSELLGSSEYLRLLQKNELLQNMTYLGSPGQAMTLLGAEPLFYFHDLEQEALDDINTFAKNRGIQSSVKTVCGDSIAAFIQGEYSFTVEDFVFIDPYSPFDSNETGDNFFAVFEESCASNAKTLLWYGYDSLKERQSILLELTVIAGKRAKRIHTFDAWQHSMTDVGCAVDPGVSGCGLAAANLSDISIACLHRYLSLIETCYKNAVYCGRHAALITKAMEL